ncbi:NAD-dependent protein deacetylase sirtuin-2-like [Convolutriloba macropyga]|uniref:NAD-dependent protein deacetylase sirtuin-2-like n=1 Tax=Convolutriloba macropyga TaxID=536237 RepID=UPI003F51B686
MGSSYSSSRAEKILDDLTLESVADYIKSGKCQNIITMIGAGMSTAAGIPDFRSPGSGLYDNLGKYNLPFPQAMFEIHYFKRHPEPFYDIARQLIDREYKPTKAHCFIKLLSDKGLLLRNYSQNVDGLEIQAGLPDKLNVEAHGTIRTSTCMKCKAAYSMGEMREKLLDGGEGVPTCDKKEGCLGLIKPDVVLFGEALPRRYAQYSNSDMGRCDLLIIMGTSLQVYPFCGLPHYTQPSCPRLLINLMKVGQDPDVPSGWFIRKMMGIKDPGLDFDSSHAYRDVFVQTTCDAGVEKLASLLGWTDELNKLTAEVKPMTWS